VRSAIALAGREEVRHWLEQVARYDSFMLRDMARRALP